MPPSSSTTKIRFGRATLTLVSGERVDLESGPLGSELDRLVAGRSDPAAVTLAYARTRIVGHSPSFDWQSADPDRLAEALCGSSGGEPSGPRDAESLAKHLLEARRERRRALATGSAGLGLVGRSASLILSFLVAAGRRTKPFARRLGRMLPASRRGRAISAIVVLVSFAAVGGAIDHMSARPDRLADDYREKAEPAFDRIAASMHRVYRSFDTYLDDSTVSAEEARNVKTIEQYKRRWLPVIDDTLDALGRAAKASGRARKTIDAHAPALAGVPRAPLVNGHGALVEARDAEGEAAEYLRRTRKYLQSFDRFVRYERRVVSLARRDLRQLDQADPDLDLEGVRADVSRRLSEAKASRRTFLKLKPHPDLEDRHKHEVAVTTVIVDYFESVQTGLENLSLAQLEEADRTFIEELKRLRRSGRWLSSAFAAESGLQLRSRRLGDEAFDLARRIAGLGTGEPPRSRTRRARAPLPPAPPRRSRPGGADRSVS